MRSASQVLLICSLSITLLGLAPCLGWLNWIGVPTSIACAVVGCVGLVSDRDPSGASPNAGLHAAALTLGLVLLVVGSIRCLLGGGAL